MASSDNQIKTNKLNIYLIKDKYLDEDSITRIGDDVEIVKVLLNNVGSFYFKKSFLNPPDWIESFFKNDKAIDPTNFLGSGSKAVLIIKILYRNKNRFFAIPFGSGRFLLRDFCYEERFGLITSLNILESKSIRGIDKRTLSTNPKSSREHIARASEAVDFQIDFEKDLIHSITGKTSDAAFGNIITGKEALSVSAKIDISNIKEFLKRTLNTFEKKDYQKNFKWIDQIKEVKIQDTITKLNEQLIKKINDKDETVWLAVPEIIDWTDFKGFKYSTRRKDKLHDELEIPIFLDETGIIIDSVSDLVGTFISCWGASNDDYLYRWNAYACLNAEIDIRKKKYFLSNSKWYEINSEFVAEVNRVFGKIKLLDLKLPDYNHAKEGDYNTEAALELKALCLDAKNLSYGGGHSKIEFCDILTKDKRLIHVKKYGGSAVLSHLFAQGFVSAELLLTDDVFRKKVIEELLPASFKKVIPLKKPNASDYSIVFAIITKQKGAKLTIPFFSKVVLKQNKKILEAYGYKMFLSKIRNIKLAESEEEG
ncbi:MAG TPA: TIGR04141 family sporadically distributed protein [Sediminibacterium sp.]|nr:TIGR04141 family sporadically distributed protein [Sediminibacterium sp.]